MRQLYAQCKTRPKAGSADLPRQASAATAARIGTPSGLRHGTGCRAADTRLERASAIVGQAAGAENSSGERGAKQLKPSASAYGPHGDTLIYSLGEHSTGRGGIPCRSCPGGNSAKLAGAAGAGIAASPLVSSFAIAQAAPKVVIVGGGAGGATVAHFVKAGAPNLDVTLIEANPIYSSSFFSNLYLGGFRTLASLSHGYGGLRRLGVRIVHDFATDVDRARKTVRTRGGRTYSYDRLVLSPGIDIKFDSIEGYSRAAARIMPHAYNTDAAQKHLLEAAVAVHAQRRDRGDGDAQQSVSLSAGALRARVHDRPLSQDPEAEVEARHPRPQEGVLQAAGVHRGVRAALQGHHRAQPLQRDRRLHGGERRSQDQGDRHQGRQDGAGRRGQRHPAAAGRRDRRQGGRAPKATGARSIRRTSRRPRARTSMCSAMPR